MRINGIMCREDLGSLAERVKWAREVRRMSREDLAEASGLSLSSIKRLESGQTKNPKGSAIVGLEDALGCDFTWLIHGGSGYILPVWGKA